MKRQLIFVVCLLFAAAARSATVTAITNNGSWTTTTTWNSGTLPVNGDNVIIPANVTVLVTGNINAGSTSLTIQVYGILSFVGGGSKLQIGAASTITVYGGGEITGQSNPSQIISIGGNQVFNAKSINVITGPSYANSTTPGFLPITPLPIKFSSIAATNDNKEVVIKWTTAAEENTSYFDIERSEDGINYIAIGRETATNIPTGASYSYTELSKNAGKHYYRIKEVDVDRNYFYSSSVEATIATANSLTITIFSTTHGILVQFPQQNTAEIKLTLVSMGGQIVSEQTIAQPKGPMVVPINSGLHGIFIATISDGKSINVSQQIVLN